MTSRIPERVHQLRTGDEGWVSAQHVTSQARCALVNGCAEVQAQAAGRVRVWRDASGLHVDLADVCEWGLWTDA